MFETRKNVNLCARPLFGDSSDSEMVKCLNIWFYWCISFDFKILFAWRMDDFPYFSIVPVCFEGLEPAIFSQNFGRADYVSPISGPGAAVLDISYTDDGSGPGVLDPVQQFLCWWELQC
jgi:hypothetical protein